MDNVDLNEYFNPEQIKEFCIQKFVYCNSEKQLSESVDEFLENNERIAEFLYDYFICELIKNQNDPNKEELTDEDVEEVIRMIDQEFINGTLNYLISKDLVEVDFSTGEPIYSATDKGKNICQKDTEIS